VAVITCVESIVAIVTFGHEWMGGVVEVGRRATKVVKVGLVHD
jgi:threonine dehydrogenase-like Zn-dependent dehydrogenase